MGGHGGVNLLGQKSWHVWRMDNRLRVERDERRAEEEENEERRETNAKRLADNVELMKRANRGDAELDSDGNEIKSDDDAKGIEETDFGSDSEMDPRKKRRMERERKMKKLSLGTQISAGASSSNQPPALSFQEELRKERKRNEKPGTREEAIWMEMEREAKGKGRGKGKNRMVQNEKFKEGKNINFFEEEEKALFQHEQEFKKRKMYQEKNNEFAAGGKGGKSRSMSEFDIVANEQPWYLQADKSHGHNLRRQNELDEEAFFAAQKAKEMIENFQGSASSSKFKSPGQLEKLTDSSNKKHSKSPSKSKLKSPKRVSDSGDINADVKEWKREKNRNSVSDAIEISSREESSGSESDSDISMHSSDSSDTRKLKRRQIRHQQKAKKMKKKLRKKKKKEAKKVKKKAKYEEDQRRDKAKKAENERKKEKLREMRLKREKEERARAAGLK